MARRLKNPRLKGNIEDHVSSFAERAEKLSDLGWRLHSHVLNWPELAIEIRAICDAIDAHLEKLDEAIDTLTKEE